MNLLSVRRELGEFKKRYKWMVVFVMVAMSAILGRLFQLQIMQNDRWLVEAEKNITKVVRLPATRGIIRDHKGRVVAQNRASYSVYVTPRQMGTEQFTQISDLLELDAEQRQRFRSKLDSVPERRRSHFVLAFNDISRDQYAAIETHRRELPGVNVVASPVRSYPFKTLGAHTLGFLNEVSAEDLKRLSGLGYGAGHSVGRSGLERAWESYLRGKDGELRVVVDVQGQELDGSPHRIAQRQLRTEPVPGLDMRLTLDMDMMRAAERAFRGQPSGGVVVVDIATGRVRALYSKPAYDLNEMSGGMSTARAKELLENPFRPLIDKTTYESYFPGSTFKPISALAALQDGIMTSSVHYDCPGYYELGKRRFRCSHVHGDTDMQEAITQSCNVYFYRLAEQVGIDRLAAYAREFGLGQKTGIGINTEASGFVPSRDWYAKNHNNKFHLGFTLNTAIGQGDTRVTLVQLAMLYAAIASNGTLHVPQLVERVEQADGTTVEEFPPRVRRHINVDPQYFNLIKAGLLGVINDKEGTAYEARIDGGVLVAGKTGTAEVSKGKLNPREDPRKAWYYRRAHSWFAGYAPADKPELAIVVLVEHGGTGGKYAAPIATQVLQDALGGGDPAKNKPLLISKKP
ncbi:MAG TPA: penicillin-binding protein 2 [Polyangiales bacterium]|nr:penicillin-binding protein 2 [Polyangiales bacterium]